MLLKKLITGILLLTSLLFITNAQAQKIKVVTEWLAPFQIKDQRGKLTGFAAEIVMGLFKITDDKPDIHILPWARAYKIAMDEKNVLIFSLAHTKQRHELFHWVGRLKYERFYFWGLKQVFAQPFKSINQVKPYVIAVSKNYNTAQYLNEHEFKNLFYMVSDNQNIGLLYKKRVDMLLSNEVVLRQLAVGSNLDFSQLRKLYEATELNNDISVAFSLLSDKALVSKYQQAYRQLVATGEFGRIRAKWSINDD